MGAVGPWRLGLVVLPGRWTERVGCQISTPTHHELVRSVHGAIQHHLPAMVATSPRMTKQGEQPWRGGAPGSPVRREYTPVAGVARWRRIAWRSRCDGTTAGRVKCMRTKQSITRLHCDALSGARSAEDCVDVSLLDSRAGKRDKMHGNSNPSKNASWNGIPNAQAAPHWTSERSLNTKDNKR